MAIKLSTTGGYDKDVIKAFNEVSDKFSDNCLLEIILSSYCDDRDIKGITEHLENRLLEN